MYRPHWGCRWMKNEERTTKNKKREKGLGNWCDTVNVIVVDRRPHACLREWYCSPAQIAPCIVLAFSSLDKSRRLCVSVVVGLMDLDLLHVVDCNLATWISDHFLGPFLWRFRRAPLVVLYCLDQQNHIHKDNQRNLERVDFAIEIQQKTSRNG